MNPRSGRRAWVKLWTNDWLEGTTRYQMTGAQRAFWIDLLAMAGRSRFGGIICSGRDGEQWIGYPLSKFQGLLAESIDIEATFELFQRTGKITVKVTGGGASKLYTLFITNWAHFQSEYSRTKKYRATQKDTQKLQPKYTLSNTTEGEVDLEGESEGEGKVDVEVEAPSAAPSTTTTFSASALPPEKPKSETHMVWDLLEIEPVGSHKFRRFFEDAFTNSESKDRVDKIEDAIEACLAAKIYVPKHVLEAKHLFEY